MFELLPLIIALYKPGDTIYETENNTTVQNRITISRMFRKMEKCLDTPKCQYEHQARLLNIFDRNPTPTSLNSFVSSANRGAPKKLVNAIRNCLELKGKYTGCLNGDIQQCVILQKGLR